MRERDAAAGDARSERGGEMSAEEYIKALIVKNPAIGKPDDEKITLTCRGLRNIIKQAHETGWQHHKEIQEKIGRLFRVSGIPKV